MKNYIRAFLLCLLAVVILVQPGAEAADTAGGERIVKVGLYYGSNALFSANLENYQGSGYALGWFDENTRQFTPIGWLGQTTISMTADGPIYISGGAYYASPPGRVDDTVGGYHVQLTETFASFEEAAYAASQFSGGFPAYINNQFRVRVGCCAGREDAETAAATLATGSWQDLSGAVHQFSGSAVSPSSTGVTVTVTKTSEVLFEFDCSGAKSLGILPNGGGGITWFKGYKWYGGFEYRRSTGGNINVINVVGIDDYVKGVLPYEMSPSWPLEALKAQAVCARTYALLQTKHYKSYRFDVCNTTDCQVYHGTNTASALTDRAAEETAGMAAYYNGKLAETYYYSSNGGASENSENVWSTALPYLRGKMDPYEGMISIPGYTYTIRYTWSQLTARLQSRNYRIGSVCDAYISRTTPTGNVLEITVKDTTGKTLTISREACRTALGTNSMRFTISGGSGGSGSLFVNGGAALDGLDGLYAVTGGGMTALPGGEAYVITSSGTSALETGGGAAGGSGITITGTGNGHNVGLSQYGAKAMAEQGFGYQDILSFYFTGITLESVR